MYCLLFTTTYIILPLRARPGIPGRLAEVSLEKLRSPRHQNIHHDWLFGRVINLMATLVSLETLPVELIASVFAELDIESLRCASETCARLRAVASDALLNPWRDPILRALTQRSPTELKHISVLSTVPRQNWIGILRYASPEFLLFDATLPNLSEDHYKTAFRKRFLPSWAKIRKSGSWREAFTKYVVGVVVDL
jgi:hypothetical protein